jgi:hypothetical protein
VKRRTSPLISARKDNDGQLSGDQHGELEATNQC